MGDYQDYTRMLTLLAPQLTLVVGVLFAALWNLFAPKAKGLTPIVCLISLAVSGYFLTTQLGLTEILCNGLFTIDPLYTVFSLIAIVVGVIVVLISMGYDHLFGRNRGEYYAILMTAILSNVFLAGSTDLIMLFVSLETLSVCCVLLTSFTKKDVRSGEATLKYLLSTAATTATLLYGLSFLYGLTGATSFTAIRDTFSMGTLAAPSFFMLLLLTLIISAICFKLSVVPFHMWTPDVYEGAPTPVTAFLSIGSKAGGFVVAMRLLLIVFAQSQAQWMVILGALAILSMVAGNLIALAQNSLKRMLAYSSIAHVGYILIGLIAASESGLSALVFYVMVYGLMNLGAFAGAVLISNETGSDRIEDYAGLIRKRPLTALAMGLCLLNLAGLPIPPAGFFAKVFIFTAGANIQTQFMGLPLGWVLVSAALITSVPAIYYYTRVVILMIVPEPSEKVAALPGAQAPRPWVGSPQEAPALALLICTVLVAAAGTISVNSLMNVSRMAVGSMALRTEAGAPISVLPKADSVPIASRPDYSAPLFQ
ncbi:MAG: NADH-quinone oxidoreductase subunit NuoN [Candidatus Obscuribacterales bacterium]|jgi:NAD(P)H-quinone oxidoreductase subunit 2